MRKAFLSLIAVSTLALSAWAATPNMPMFRWENFTTANGLPDNHVFCVLVDGNRIWAGTDNGLGLYEKGKLRPIGHTSGLKAKEKKELVKTLKPYETGERGSGDPSRWDADRDLEWHSLRPELVVEVTYDHTSGGRIRHGSKIVRWREDKAPKDCKIDQLV